jgi:hypothetical protein
MAQSPEGKLILQVREGLNRADFNIAHLAQGTTSYSPYVKNKLVQALVMITDMHAIDFAYGNYRPEEFEALELLALLSRYTKTLDNGLIVR